MAVIAATNQQTLGLPTASTSGKGAAVPASATAGSARSPVDAGTDTRAPAVALELSPHARALLQGQQILQALPKSFDELVTQKTTDLAKRLIDAFTAEHIPLDEAIALRVDRSGTIHAEGPYKERIEKYFKDNPEAAEEFKAVATLNALRASQEVLRLQNEELRSARTEEERDAARNRSMLRSMDIQSLYGSMTLKDGELTSAATRYVSLLSERDPGELADDGLEFLIS